jgi:hypothetical protein
LPPGDLVGYLWETDKRKIHAYEVWVAYIKLSEKDPFVLLANYIQKKDVILIYRVLNLDNTVSEL